MTDVRWHPIPDFPGYAVSCDGQVMRTCARRGARAGHIMRQWPNRDGYLCVTLNDKPRRQTFLVNRIVCEAFHGSPPTPEHHAAHANGDRRDNRATNLRWASHAENESDKIAHGTQPRGEKHGNAKLTAEAVRSIRADPRGTYAIAKEYGTSQSLISQVRNRKVWAHV